MIPHDFRFALYPNTDPRNEVINQQFRSVTLHWCLAKAQILFIVLHATFLGERQPENVFLNHE